MHINGMQSFNNIFAKMVENSFKKHGFINIRLLQDWPQIVGHEIAQICKPHQILKNHNQGGTLHLHTSNPAYSLIILTQKDRIIDNISTYFGYKAVSKIRILVKS